MTRFLACIALALTLAGCAVTAPRTADTAAVTFIVVRHAEKVDASRDPDLSPAGHARAQALAASLGERELAAAYATEFKRTSQTLAPSAEARGMAITPYPAGQPATEFAARLRATHPRGAVLIAGHSNTVPDIVAALCACTTAPIPDHEYDRLSNVRTAADGRARLHVAGHGAASPAP